MVSQDPRKHDAAPDERVALLLAAAAAPAEAGPQPGEAQALAAFRASPHHTRRFSMFSTPSRAKVAVASTIGAGCFLFAGVGAAAAGVLPGAAQDTAHTWLGTLGIEVPGPDAHSAGHAAVRGTSTEVDDPADATDTEDTEGIEGIEGIEGTETDATETETQSQGKGADVSGLATSTTAQGVDKGAEISTLASGGKSRAGADHTAPAAPEDAADAADGADSDSDQAPVEHPNSGGTGTAGDATAEDGDGASASGTGTADEASSGHSASGSGNRP
jgi:hypothetical protein